MTILKNKIFNEIWASVSINILNKKDDEIKKPEKLSKTMIAIPTEIEKRRNYWKVGNHWEFEWIQGNIKKKLCK